MENETGLTADRPSRRIMKIWARRITSGKAKPVMVYVGGSWTIHVLRGNRRGLQVSVGDLNGGGAIKEN